MKELCVHYKADEAKVIHVWTVRLVHGTPFASSRRQALIARGFSAAVRRVPESANPAVLVSRGLGRTTQDRDRTESPLVGQRADVITQ